MRGQDVLVLLKLLCDEARPATLAQLLRAKAAKEPRRSYQDLSRLLGMSASEAHAAMKRLRVAGLVHPGGPANRTAAEEFLQHGFKYVFPPEAGSASLGMLTAAAAPVLDGPLNSLLMPRGDDLPWVWPTPEGSDRGLALTPIYRSVPVAAANDPLLYAWLAVLDCLRLGRARERKFAVKWLGKKLHVAIPKP